MENVFLKILNMSICAGWVILAVLVLRLLLHKAPKAVRVVLWGVVGLRLVWPFSLESSLSLIPSAQTVPGDIGMAAVPAIQSGVPLLNSSINPVLAENFAATPYYSANPMQIFQAVAALVWAGGMVVMALYALVSWLVVRHRVREAVRERENIWLCDRLGSPFILGLVFPRIYLPSDISREDMVYVLAHEQAHLKRRDHLWKPLGFALLVVHWFNPLVWLAYILLCRDIELACDEKALAQLGEEGKKPYSRALINCSVPRRMVAACPVAFGETGVKGRIKLVLHYKKPAVLLIAVAVLACVAVGVCFLTDPPKGDKEISVTQADMSQPPTLQISAPSADSVEAVRLSYDWKIEGEQRQYLSVSPTSYDSLPLLKMLPISYSYTKGNVFMLNFTTEPDFVTMSARTLDLISAGEDRYAHYYMWSPQNGKPLAFEAQEGTYVYEVTARWDGYGKCEYIFRVDFSLPEFTELEKLWVTCPQYFQLPTDKGLEVYIWQMAKGSYSCVLVPGSNLGYTEQEIYELPALTMEQMRLVLSTYNIDRSKIVLQPIRVLYSSYWYEIDDDYCAELERRFWSEE